MNRRIAAWLGALALAVSTAQAQPCAGFSDVDVASPFCVSIEWIRNRGVTQGCAAGLYCPGAIVSRLAMAAFMNRLGTALTPQPLVVEANPGALDLDPQPVVCTTATFAVSSFPRIALIDGSFRATTSALRSVNVVPVQSLDGGATWAALTIVEMLAGIPANTWQEVPIVWHHPIDVGANVRFGLRVTSDLQPGPDVVDSRCRLRVRIHSRDGSTSPY